MQNVLESSNSQDNLVIQPRKRKVVFSYHPQFLFEMEFRVLNIVSNLMQVMVSRPRSDLHINLPALRKLDTMLVV